MSKTIVGRAYEQQVLTDSLTSHRSELLVIYGRRRIGKTYLIREFFGNKITFSFTGLSTGKRAAKINTSPARAGLGVFVQALTMKYLFEPK